MRGLLKNAIKGIRHEFFICQEFFGFLKELTPQECLEKTKKVSPHGKIIAFNELEKRILLCYGNPVSIDQLRVGLDNGTSKPLMETDWKEWLTTEGKELMEYGKQLSS